MKNVTRETWEGYEKVVEETELRELWHGLVRAAGRKDLFWSLFYTDRLSTVCSQIRLRETLPVIKY